MTEEEMVGQHCQLNGPKRLSKLQKIEQQREAWYAMVHGVTKYQT